MSTDFASPNPESTKSGDSLIDIVAHDPKIDQVVLIMKQDEPWTGENDQLFHLQERFNTYASFLLDGELSESHPDLAGKSARIELRCAHIPENRTIDLLGQIRDQLALQEIDVQVVVRGGAL